MPNFTPNGYHCDIGHVGGGDLDLTRLSRDFVLYCTNARLPKRFVRKTESEASVTRRASVDLDALTRKYV